MDNKKAILAIFLIALMIAGSLFVIPLHNNSSAATSQNVAPAVVNTGKTITPVSGSTASPSAGISRSQLAHRAIELANQSNTPLKYVFLPNFASVSGIRAGHITPGYSQSPAPMGIGFYGLYNKSGVVGTQNYTFPAAEAHINLTQLQTMNLADGAPQGVTFQLNAVLNNVNLFGNSSYAMWTQNVIFYSARTHQVSFDLNIWNFSSSSVAWSQNAIYHSSGVQNPYTGAYIVLGPTYQLSNANLSINLYLNTSLVGGRQAVNFNYSLTGVQGKTGVVSGTYDQAVFNSSTNAAPLHYLVSGTNLTPTGFIPYDAEIMVGGPGGGSTATIMNISGSMNLMYFNTTTKTFQNVPNAYDIGSETGETSVGVDVHYVGTTAILTGGPSLVYGMWNETNSTFNTYNVKLNHGTNSYMFVAQSSALASQGFWNWASVNYGKNFVYYLPKSTSYVWEGLSNYYNFADGSLNSTGHTYVNFTSNATMGIYTPIIADGNAQAALVATSGAGTSASPYVIMADAHAGMLNTIFGQINDYVFPAFPGVLIYNTNVYVDIENFSMNVQYTGVGGFLAGYYGLPTSNGMNMWIYNSSNVEVEHGIFSSWYSFQQSGYFEGTLTTWNSTNLNIYDNNFTVWSMGAFSYNAPDVKANILYSDNNFTDIANTNGIPLSSTYYGLFLFGSSPTGLMLFSNNTSLHGNKFITQITVLSCDYNYYTGAFANYSGDNLNGNYWWNYNGAGSYTNNGVISTGASDNTPLILPGANVTLNVPSALVQSSVGINSNYVVTFDGLMVTMNPALTGISSVPLFDILAPKAPSSQIFTMESTDSSSSMTNPSTGDATQPYTFVNITTVSIHSNETLNFNLFTGDLTVFNTNSGSSWAPVLNGVLQPCTSASSEILYNIPYGLYMVSTYSVGQAQTTVSSYFIVLDAPNMLATDTLTFSETGLASGTTWSVNVDGNVYSSTTSSISINAPAGNYNYSVMAPTGYTVSNGAGSVSVSASTTVSVSFKQATYTLTFSETGLSNGTSWTVSVNGHVYTSNTSTLTVSVPYGSVNYAVGSVSGFSTGSSNNTIFVAGNGQIAVTYSSVSVSGTSTIIVVAAAVGSAVVGLLVGIFVLSPLMRKKQ